MLVNQSIQTIHFSGICGTAMASLAVLLKKRGFTITGSDQGVYPPMSTFLQQNGIAVMEGYQDQNLFPAPDLVVIGNALSRGNAEVEAVLNRNLPFISMAELLKEFFLRGKTPLVVTGTHGKTTTSALLAWIFESAGRQPGFMIGGVLNNFGGGCQPGAGEYFVVEGDEYDTAFFDKRSKFFHYLPNSLIINNIEFDHADIFDSLETILKSFRLLLRLVPSNGLIVAGGDDPNVREVLKSAHSPVLTFGMGQDCDIRIHSIQNQPQGSRFCMIHPTHGEHEFTLPMMGAHNIRNACAAIAVATHHGIWPQQIQTALHQFKGIKRRLELRGRVGDQFVYDDFAHHPTAIRETIASVRQKHPDCSIVAAFEPRSNTSVLNLHQQELIASLRGADEVLLSQPHRQQSIPVDQRLDVNAVCASLIQLGTSAQTCVDFDQLLEQLAALAKPKTVFLLMSNGKFGNLHQRLLERLQSP